MGEQTLTQGQIREFVIPAHGDLETVKRMLADNPALLDARYEEWNETPLGAASHVGNRAIAEYLLAQGAAPTICTSAMLGRADEVAVFLKADPAQANARGAHGIPVLFHAAMSGDTRIADLLVANGGGEGANDALYAAIAFGHTAMVKWLLAHGASDVNRKDWQGKTPLAAAEERGLDQIAEMLRAKGAVA